MQQTVHIFWHVGSLVQLGDVKLIIWWKYFRGCPSPQKYFYLKTKITQKFLQHENLQIYGICMQEFLITHLDNIRWHWKTDEHSQLPNTTNNNERHWSAKPSAQQCMWLYHVCWLENRSLFLPMQSSLRSFWNSFTGLVQLIFSFSSWFHTIWFYCSHMFHS